MENGTFNNIKKIGNFVVKISKNNNDISKQILEEMDSGNVEKYVSDINHIGIKTAKVYANWQINGYSIMIQEYIDGITIQDILISKTIPVKDKIFVFKMFLEIFNRSKKDSNLCLDWNMKNFIYNGDDIYYIDFVPCLYKDKIMNSYSENLFQYKESYLNEMIQIAGILGYAIMPFLNENINKHDERTIYLEMKTAFESICGIKLNFDEITNHVYIYKIKQIESFLNSDMSYSQLKNNLNSNSMEKNFYKIKEKCYD